MTMRRLKFWGWGYEGDVLSAAQVKRLEAAWASVFNAGQFEVTPAPQAGEIELRPPRIAIPASLSDVCTSDHYQRLLHSYGHSFVDSVRKFARDFSNPPDAIAYPRREQDIVDVLDWCSSVGAAVVPFGGGTSVVGGVEPPPDTDRSVVTIDLKRMNRVLEVDSASEAALIQAGATGPALEEQLKRAGLTLRFFPQSFEFSTLGGWIATRAAGHFATLYTHIDDLVESIRAVTPTGICESRRLPASGAGPSPDRLWLGSEGVLGVVTQAWVRVRKEPAFRAAATVAFRNFYAAAEAVRLISQAGLYPANCRALDPIEAAISESGDGRRALLLLAFESADHSPDAWLARALEICSDCGGAVDESQTGDKGSGATGRWREHFLRAPWLREEMTARGIIADTFETAITWDRFRALSDGVREATSQALLEATGRPGLVSCRLTHVYPDGPAPYFTFVGLGDKGRLIEQFWTIKQAVSEAVLKFGGTITHHHAVGRDHRRWYDQQRPAEFAVMLRAAKSAVDPRWMLNPGVLIDAN